MPVNNNDGPRSVLHIAVERGNIEILRMLLDDLKKVNNREDIRIDKYDPKEAMYIYTFKETHGNAYNHARYKGREDMCRILLETEEFFETKTQAHIFYLNYDDAERETNGNLPSNDPFVDLGALVRSCTNETLCMLHSNRDLFCLLDTNGDSVLHHALDSDNHIAFEYILQSEYFDILKNKTNIHGLYPLCYALNDIYALEKLLEKGCKILLPKNNSDERPSSILHLMIHKGTDKGLELLLNDLLKQGKYSFDEISYIIDFEEVTSAKDKTDAYHLALSKGKQIMAESIRYTQRMACQNTSGCFA